MDSWIVIERLGLLHERNEMLTVGGWFATKSAKVIKRVLLIVIIPMAGAMTSIKPTATKIK